MAEGGNLPWKRQTIDMSRGRPCDYSELSKPLPAPPRGVAWTRDAGTKGEWKLTKTDPQEKRKYTVQVGDAWNARRGRVEPTLIPIPKLEETTTKEPPKTPPLVPLPSSASSPPPQNDPPLPPPLPEEGVDFLLHTSLPSDTLMGLCLRYKTNATTLRQINKFSGSNLLLAPSTLIIPLTHFHHDDKNVSWLRQDTTTHEYKMQAFLSEFPQLRAPERRAYLEMSDWNLQEAIRNAQEDEEWEEKEKTKTVVPCSTRTLDVFMAVPAVATTTSMNSCQNSMKQKHTSGRDGSLESEGKELMEPLLKSELELEMARRDHIVL